ncbi:hypothetical protein NPX13_g6557 [Xylaria arbuscula]|uniref:Uncharacterized protein n=1 Tax=Xylaria arbuscula TaxID=114810 RepID=A0A9W8NC51_9PEZI|nr:hypothetical protein NPX13_g6557 [Xylaria arbuscula]
MSPKRKREVCIDGGDSGRQTHSSKRAANPREENTQANPSPVTVHPSHDQSAPLDPTDGLPDAVTNTAVEATHRLELSQVPYDEQVDHNTRIRELERRLCLLENERNESRSVVSDSTTNDQEELEKKPDVARSQLKATEDNLQAEQDRLEAVKSELESIRTRWAEELQGMVTNLESEKARCDQLAQDIKRVGIAKDAVPNLDGNLKDKFRALRSTVRRFTRTYCDRKILNWFICGNLVKGLATLSNIAVGSFFESELHAQYFVESHIWRVLYQMVLVNPYVIWGKSELIGQVIPSIFTYSEASFQTKEIWRFMTGQVLIQTRLAPEKLKNWADEFIGEVAPLTNSTSERKHVEAHLKAILNEAVEIAKILCQTRARCHVIRKLDVAANTVTPRYDKKWMEIIERGVGGTDDVDFIVSPALIQRMHPDGDGYDSVIILVKAEVCFGQGSHPAISNSLPNKAQQAVSKPRITHTVNKSSGGVKEE